MAEPSAKAQLIPQPDGPAITVHFNPASLSYTLESKSSQQSRDPKKRQHVAEISGKLTMDLQFDTTDAGYDVRTDTAKIARLLQASADATQNATANQTKAPPVVQFKWGSYEFNGMLDSFKETIDLFSDSGVALRALVNISMSQQDVVFDDSGNLSDADTSGTLLPPSSAQAAAQSGGDPRAARQLASNNGQESIRFGDGSPLQVSASVQFNPPVAFVSASASAGFGAGAGIGIGAGAGIGISGGAGIGVSGGAGIGIGGGVTAGAGASAAISFGGGGAIFGSKASAGVSAGAGAFAGLEIGRATVTTTAQLNPQKMLPATVSADVSTGAGASFSLGGAANSSVSAGLSADVGASFRFSDRLKFEGD